MEIEEFADLIKATADRLESNGSDAFRHLIKQWAADGNFTAIAEGAALYVTLHPETRNIIRASVPRVIASQYFPRVPGFSHTQFARWSEATPKATESLRKAFNDPRALPLAVAAIVKQILDFKR